MELYEAVYFFSRMNGCGKDELPQKITRDEIAKWESNEAVYHAVIRILVVNNLLQYNDSHFVLTRENKEGHRYILEDILNENQKEQYGEMFDRAVGKPQFFFDCISEAEYEIYSRYNFQITSTIGKEVAKHVDLTNKKVLELGGNSGGLGTTLLSKNKNCSYTVVDTKIPCKIGNELKKSNDVNIEFIESDIFTLVLPSQVYHGIIIMNLLHDFDDVKCLQILNNCIIYCNETTKFFIIEDILTDQFQPKEAIMHGLRLSASCSGGKQRIIEELESLFLKIHYKLEKSIKLDNVHSLLVFGAVS